MSIRVIGLGNQRPADDFSDVLATARIFARERASASTWLGDAGIVAHDFSALFDELAPREICDRIGDTLATALNRGESIVYLVPGAANIGDATVAALSRRFEGISVIPGATDCPAPLGNTVIVDALDLAVSEYDYPFDAGSHAIDPTGPLVITNLTGSAIVPLARQRLQRVYDEVELEVNATGTLFLRPLPFPGSVSSFTGLETIVAQLRSPAGCPWDREQTPETLVPLMLEEIEEFLHAWSDNQDDEQADELGDVLLHVLMIAQIGRETGRFTREDVLRAITAKMVRRHPHVFGDVEITSVEDVYRVWNQVKDSERARSSLAEEGLGA